MKRIWFIVPIIAILLSVFFPKKVQALPGTPGSPDFGYGAWLHLDGNFFNEGINALNDLPLDWVAIDFNWLQLMPDSTQMPNLTELDQVMQSAAANQIAVMISLTNPPEWAITSQGPDIAFTSQLVVALAGRYPGILQAIELLPGANTSAGFKSTPNPSIYVKLYAEVKNALSSNGHNIILVAGGLKATNHSSLATDWNDLDFLRGMYTSGAAKLIDVISIQYPWLTGNPLSSPEEEQGLVLRHYEIIRQIMLENNHISGLIWITQLSVPDGTIDIEDKIFLDQNRQAEWLQQAVIQIRSQLYVGVAFIQNINPAPPNSITFGNETLIINPGNVHPFFSALKAIIQETHPEKPQDNSGRPKGNSLLKCKYKT